MSYRTATIDVFDDRGAILRRLCPTRESLPEAVKLASAASREEIPQSAFAVVLVEDGVAIPRFPLSDEGHTVMSVLYFDQTHGTLPEEAQKVAAARLAKACEAYGLGVPKLLSGLSSDLGWCDPVVHVRGDEPVKVAAAPEADMAYAVADRWPLGSAAEIRAAQDYFSENLPRFDPEMRREFAVNTAQAALAAGLQVSDDIAKYAGMGWNPGVRTHLDTRRVVLRERGASVDALIGVEKLAEAVGNVSIDQFAEDLLAFDRKHGLDGTWGKELYDPLVATFDKLAGAGPKYKTWTLFSEHTTEIDLQRAVEDSRKLERVEELFGVTAKSEFAKSPVAFFEALPPRKQLILGRIARGQ